MITEQTRRRRRGRAIRKARRIRTAMPRELRPIRDWVEENWARIRAAVRDWVEEIWARIRAAIDFVQVLAARTTPLPLAPRDGAGARRQLLERGRAPRKGGR